MPGTDTAAVPPGFEPRSGVAPFWLHTIELSRGRLLAGAVVVIDRQYLPAVVALIGYDGADLIVHQDGREMWLRLNRRQAVHLVDAVGQQSGDNEPGYVPGVDDEMVLLVNILNNED